MKQMLLDKEQRTVVVDRIKLIATLENNLTKHVQEHSEAMAGYKDALSSKIDSAFESAKTKLDRLHVEAKAKVAALTDEEITKSRDHFTLIDGVTVEMKVPRSYASEYEAAIDMAKWDTRETLELTSAEFSCFVRDQWDWKVEFMAVSAIYNKAGK